MISGKIGAFALSALITSFTLTVGATSAQAESSCKGLEQAACGKKSDCSWVGGYTRKDGRKVSSHCRTKSTGGKKTTSSDKKKSSKGESKSTKDTGSSKKKSSKNEKKSSKDSKK